MNRVVSFVIQMCVETTRMEHLALELINSDQLVEVASDSCGNDILQKILEKSKIKFPHLYKELRSKLVSKWGELKKYLNGKNVLIYL